MKPEDFGLTTEDLNERAVRFKKQREDRGWDDSETFSLFTTLAEWLAPRLERFKEVNFCHPCSITMEEWTKTIDKMSIAFKIIAADGIYSKKEGEQIEEGLDLFRKYYLDLWW